ncbi:MAG: hypothetical protein EBS01_09120, partial [Verrucomicrobia bacterium]|nr:hypothetical protein [Verrucomicrobiota bacterium]
TPSVSINRLFTMAGNATIDSSGQYGTNVLGGGGPNNAALVFNNTGAVSFSGTGVRTLTLQGNSTGDNEIKLQLTNNTTDASALSVTKAGTGLWILSGANTYSGATTINAGQLQAVDGTGLSSSSNLVFGGGVFQSTGSFTRTAGTGVQWSSATTSGGFAAAGSKLTVNLGGVAAMQTWGATNGFMNGSNTSALILNSATALSEVEFVNPIDLGAPYTNTRTIQVDDNTSATTDFATISGVISGNWNSASVPALTKTGAGVLYLTGANTFTNAAAGGGLSINQGAVVVNSFAGGGPLGALNNAVNDRVIFGSTNTNSIVYVGAGETVTRRLELAGAAGGGAIIENNGSGPLVITDMNFAQTGAKGLTLQGANSDYNTISAVIGGAANTALTKAGNGTWVLPLANTYTGATTLSGGLLVLGNDNSLGATTSAINVTAATTLQSTGGAGTTRTINNTITISSGDLIFAGSANFTLGAAVSNSGGTRYLTNFLASPSVLTLNGAVNLQDSSSARTFVLRGTGTTVLTSTITNGGSAAGTIQIEMSPSTNLNSGPGMVILGAASIANTYTGNTNLSTGVFQLNTPLGSYTSTPTPLGASTNELRFIGSAYLQSTNAVTFSQALTLNATTAFTGVVQSPSALTFNGVSSNTGANNTLLNNGTGLLTLGGFNLQDTTNARTVTLGGIGNITITGPVANSGSAAGSLSKSGSGTLTLQGSNTFTGALTVSGGVLSAANVGTTANQLGAGVLTLGAGSLTITKADATTATQTYASTTLSANTSPVLTLSTTNAGASLTINTGVITRNSQSTMLIDLSSAAGTGVVNVGSTTLANWALLRTAAAGMNFATKNGSNNLTPVTTTASDALSAFTTSTMNATDAGGAFTGTFSNTTGTAGLNTLRFNAAAASTFSIASNSMLNITGGASAAGAILVTPSVGAFDSAISGGILTSSGGELIVFQQNPQASNQLNISSRIENAYNAGTAVTVALTKAGNGTLLLNNPANAYTGATSINAGVLRVSGGNAIGDISNVTLANNTTATLDLNGNNETIGSLAGGGLLGNTVSAGIVTG